MSGSDIRLERVAEFLGDLEAARTMFQTAEAWPDFDDWHHEVDEFLDTECNGQWPDTMFRALRFKPQEESVWVAFNATEIDTSSEEKEKVRTWQRASARASMLLRRMLDGNVPWKRPYGMEPPKLERSGLPAAIYAGGDVLINVGTIESSQIQQGSSGSKQVLTSGDIDKVLSDVLAFVGAAREATKDKEAVRDKISPIVDGLENAARAAKPSMPAIKSLLQALSGLLTAGDHVTAIVERIPALIAAVERFGFGR